MYRALMMPFAPHRRWTMPEIREVAAWGFLNGWFMPEEHVWIPGKAHLAHYASLIFEGLRYVAKAGGIFLFEEHLARMRAGMKTYRFALPEGFTDEDSFWNAYRSAILLTAALNRESYVRPFLGRGTRRSDNPRLESGLHVRPQGTRTIWACLTEPWDAPYIETKGKAGSVLLCSDWERPLGNVMPVSAKGSGNYTTAAFASQDAFDAGFGEGLMIRMGAAGGIRVLDGPGQALGVVQDGTLFMPHADESGILKSTTATWVKEKLAPMLGIPCVYSDITFEALLAAQEFMYFGSASGLVPIGVVGERDASGSIVQYTIGDGSVGPVFSALFEAFTEVMDGRRSEFASDFTPVPTVGEARNMLVEHEGVLPALSTMHQTEIA